MIDKNAVAVSLAIAQVLHVWLRGVPASSQQKLLGLQFVSRLIETGETPREQTVTELLERANGAPSLNRYKEYMNHPAEARGPDLSPSLGNEHKDVPVA